MRSTRQLLRQLALFCHGEEAQTMAEYGIVLAVLAVTAIGIFPALSGGIAQAIGNVTNLLR
jgi:Flp pilus assembly pilin Flp